MSLLTPEPGLVFWMTLSFGVVLFVLAKYAFPTILQSVEKRKKYIDESLQAARDAQTELANVKKTGEELLAATREEQATMLRETAKLREKLLIEAQADARKESDKLIEEARERVRAEKEEALRQIRNEVATLSLNLTEKILRDKLNNDQEQMNLIDRLLDETNISKS